jgi:hypothetical protein
MLLRAPLVYDFAKTMNIEKDDGVPQTSIGWYFHMQRRYRLASSPLNDKAMTSHDHDTGRHKISRYLDYLVLRNPKEPQHVVQDCLSYPWFRSFTTNAFYQRRHMTLTFNAIDTRHFR